MRPIDADKLMECYENTSECNIDDCLVPIPVIRQNILDMSTVNPYEWISVKDSEPKQNGYYLCWRMKSKCGDREEWQIDKLYWEDNLWLMYHNTFKTVDYVTHYMPLPVPPGHIRINVRDIVGDKFGFWTLKEN